LASTLAATQSSLLLQALYLEAIVVSAQASVLSRGQSSRAF
jgi:hypothetical protein